MANYFFETLFSTLATQDQDPSWTKPSIAHWRAPLQVLFAHLRLRGYGRCVRFRATKLVHLGMASPGAWIVSKPQRGRGPVQDQTMVSNKKW